MSTVIAEFYEGHELETLVEPV